MTAPLNQKATNMTEQPSLSDSEVEATLLGAIIADPSAYHRVADRIQADAFAFGLHENIFDTVERLIAAGKPSGPSAVSRVFRSLYPDTSAEDRKSVV